MGTFIDLMSVDLLRAPVGSPASNIPTHVESAANSILAMSGANNEQRSARFQDLVDLLLSVPKSNFDPFHVHRTSYRSAGRDIGTDVLVPKRPSTGTSRPVMVRIHGGFLVTGSSLFPAWFSKWILEYAELHSAVIISPDYRLLPEVKGTDILDDMAAFWTWFHKGGPSGILQQYGYREKLDPSKLLLLGESAGGYLAVQSVLSGFVQPDAMVLLYPMLDMKADHYTKEYTKLIVNVPNFPSSVVDDFLATLPPTADKRSERATTEADPPERLDLALASVQTGRYLDFIGTEPRLFVLDRIEGGDYARRKSGKGAVLPPVFLLHGNEDSAVPIQGSYRFLEALRKADRNAPIHTAFCPGDHGFDFQATLEDGWLLAGLKWAEEEWLVERSKM